MNRKQQIAALREQATAKSAERAKHVEELEQIRSAAADDGNRNMTEDEVARANAARSARDTIDAEVATINERADELEADERSDEAARKVAESGEKRHSPATVVREPRMYSAEKSARGEASFFVDAFRLQHNGDQDAAQRLQRHAEEVRAEGEMSERATTTGSYAGLVVPQYLVEMAAPLARAGRPFANTVNRQQIPAQGMNVVIPRGTTGASEAVQATQNSNVSNTDQVWQDLNVPVVTIAGQQDVSRQSLERGYPGLDELVYTDLAGAYAVALDLQVLGGSGASGQMLGVLNTAGINQATAFGAAATPQTYYTKVAGQVNAVETTRFMAPNAIALHPRRWNWLISQFDGQQRPMVVPTANGPMNAIGVFDMPIDTVSASPVGQFQGLPVITDASIPTSVGTGPEDQTIVYRREDLLLWEDLSNGGLPKQLRFEQTLGNQLTVKLVAYNYAAFTAGRYPSSVGVVGGNASAAGNGTVAPQF